MFRCFMLYFALFIPIAFTAPTYQYHLKNISGEIVTEKDFPEQYQMIAFGFTHCPDVCPTTLYEFKQVMAQLAHPERLQPIFITIDPTRDTLAQLSAYTGYFDKRILPLGGSREMIDEAVNHFNASYGYQLDGQKLDPDNLPEDNIYTVYHSTLIYILDMKGELIDVFDYQTGAEQLLDNLKMIIHDDV